MLQTKGASQGSYVRYLKKIAEYAGVGMLNLFITYIILGLWNANFSAPFRVGGDTDFHPIMSQTIKDTGWIFSNTQLGYPAKLTIYDVPQGGDNLSWFVLKLLNYFLTATQSVNVHFVLSFPIVAMAAYGAARWWGLQRSTALVVSALYAFLPYHLIRNVGHQLLTVYAVIPLVLVYCYYTTKGVYRLAWPKLLIFAVAIASLGSYYAVFSLLLIALALGWNLLNREWVRMKQPMIFVGVIVTVFLFNQLPSFLYWARNGTNPARPHRSVQDAENYGLQIANMFSPRPGHRIDVLSRAGSFIQKMGTPSEEGHSLGIIAGLGIIGLFAYSAYKIIISGTINPKFKFFAVIVPIIVIFTVSSGLSTLVAYAGFTTIRSWNRVVVIIAFIGLLAAGYFYEHCVQYRLHKRKYGVQFSAGILVFLLLFGLWDQSSTNDRVNNIAYAQRLKSDCEFVQKIEDTHPGQDGVFQLPFVGFPEFPWKVRLGYYTQGLLILCDTNLRFSYGAMTQRHDAFQREIAGDDTLSGDEIEKLRDKGFSTIIVYRLGYEDRGVSIENQLTELFGEPIESQDGTMVAFSIDI